MTTQRVHYGSYNSPYDPCPTLIVDWTKFLKLPELFIDFQPYGLPQYAPNIALRHGTLWPTLFSPYHNPYEYPERGEESEQ